MTQKHIQKNLEPTKKNQKEDFQNSQLERFEKDFKNQEIKEKNEEQEMDFSIQLRKKFINCGMDFKGIKYVWGSCSFTRFYNR